MTNPNITTELKLASEEHARKRAHFDSLVRTALDRTLSKETRLRAVMQIDNIIWLQRSVTVDYVGAPDKIALAKAAAERRRLDRDHAERIAKGLPVRPRKINGVWVSTDPLDTLAAPPPGVCIECGRGFDPDVRRSIYCSAMCRRLAYRARKRMVNAA